MSKIEKQQFKTNVGLKNVIGKELINDDDIAVLELVKNSFDAVSPEVRVIFENIKTNDDGNVTDPTKITDKTSELLIEDQGSGMNHDDITNKWLNIAYSEKREIKQVGKRVMAGAKGVGRFSCDRLGQYLTLYTRKKGYSIFRIFIDWKEFEEETNRDKQIQQVKFELREMTDSEFRKETKRNHFSHGTILKIQKLRSPWTFLEETKKSKTWNEKALFDLRTHLEKLINPNQVFKKGDNFRVFLLAAEFHREDKSRKNGPQINGIVRNRVFDSLKFKTTSVEATISFDGKKINTLLKDKGRTIFELVERNEEFPLLKNAKIILYYLNPYAKAHFLKQTGMRSVDFGSVHLFVNGFRVSPYGDLGNDWLGIDRRKAQGYSRYIGNRELVGRIELIDNEGYFKVISSREGIVKNDHYKQLTDSENKESFFYITFLRLEKYVVEGLDWDRAPKDFDEDEVIGAGKKIKEVFIKSQADKDRDIVRSFKPILNVNPDRVMKLTIDEGLVALLKREEEEKLKKTFSDFEKFDSKVLDKKMQDALKTVGRILEKKERELVKEVTERKVLEGKSAEQEHVLTELQKNYKQVTSQNLFLKAIGSLDLDHVIALHHHIGISADNVQQDLDNVSKRLRDGEKLDQKQMLQYLGRIGFEVRKILTITKFATKANFNLTSTEFEKSEDLVLFIREYIQNVCENVYKAAQGKKMSIQVATKSDKEFKLKFKPIEISMMIDNFLSNSGKAGANNVQFILDVISGNELELRINDDGHGIEGKNLGEIFGKGFSTTDGSGLGLYHVKDMIEKMHGKISVDTKYKDGAGFILEFRK